MLDLGRKGKYMMTNTVSAPAVLLAIGLVAGAMPVFAADATPPSSVPATGAPSPAPTPPALVDPAPPQAPAAAQSSDVSKPPSPDSIATLRVFIQQGADINYLGRKYGLDGWLVSLGNAVQVLYTTADGQATVVGLLYGPDGNVETANQLVAAKARGLNLQHTTAALADAPGLTGAPAPQNAGSGVVTPAQLAASLGVAGSKTAAVNPLPASAAAQTPSASAAAVTPPNPSSPSERFWSELENSTYIKFGSPTAAPLYVFMDPTCHWCHDYFASLMTAYVPQGAVQLRVVPVGILSDNAKQEASLILSAVDPAAAWSSAETHDLSSLPKTPAEGAMQKLDSNQRLMGEWNFRGTPGSVYRGKDGKVKVVYGMPDSVPQVVGDIAAPAAR